MIGPSLMTLFLVSLMSPRHIRRLAGVIFLAGIALLVMTLLYGIEVKGAKRWVNLGGFSLQASEFVKPAFSVVVGWVLAEKFKNPKFPGFSLSLGLLGLFVSLLILQPDLGMTIVVATTYIVQLFISGLPILWLIILGTLSVLGITGAYVFLPHVAKRIDQFLDPSSCDVRHDLYQVNQSLGAFMKGGVFGKGPGEGVIKKYVPDAHADFIFAVAGEEFGFILCLCLVLLFLSVIVFAILRLLKENNLFAMLTVPGLVTQFGLQAWINMASALHLTPTKGMTMPFISYGGSSMLAIAISMGFVLALTRRRSNLNDIY